MRAHEAGALHGNDLTPTWLPYPADVNALLPGLWSRTTTREADGVLQIAGIDVREIADAVGTPAFVVDEADFRSRAREFRGAFEAAFAGLAGCDVFYAGKAFLSVAIARWMDEEGLGIDVCTGGELAIALRAGVPGEKLALHGNNKSDAEIRHALEAGIGRIVVDSFGEIEQISHLAAELGLIAPVFVRVTAGVEAHTHEFIATSHEDQKFGLSLSAGDALRAVREIVARPDVLHLAGVHSHIGSQIFDTGGFEVAARRLMGFLRTVRDETGHDVGELDLGGGFGVMYNSQHTPQTPARLAEQMASIVRAEAAARDLNVPRVSIEPGRAIAGPSTQTLYEVGTVKDVLLDGGQRRLYVAVDGGMSDNIRTALYDADYSVLLSSRASDADPRVVRIVGRHCESGDIVVKDEYLPGDVEHGDLVSVPVTGAYCYSLASNYNHTPRPPVVAVRDGELTVLIRRETEEDLFALDVG